MGSKMRKDPVVLVTREDRVAKIILNVPEKMNAASLELFMSVTDALNDVAADTSVRAVILTGAGKSFCAGADIPKEIARFQKMSGTEFADFTSPVSAAYLAAYRMAKPVIAAINGYAIGIGVDLALSCDIRIAAEDTKLGVFEVKMGLAPEISTYLLPRLIGLSRAKLLSFTGDMIDAQEAFRLGMVDKVVPPDSLMAEAESLARKLADGPLAIPYIKKAMNDSLEMSLESSLRSVFHMQYQLTRTEDHKEAVAAFLEKRQPQFQWR